MLDTNKRLVRKGLQPSSTGPSGAKQQIFERRLVQELAVVSKR